MRQAARSGNVFTVRNHDCPPVEPDEVRLRIGACGICGTDLQDKPETLDGEYGFGHEMAGTVIECGKAVRDLTVGQTVAVESSTACGRCDACRNARQELCANILSPFVHGLFGFAEEMVLPAITCIPYEGLTADIACLSEPLAVAIDMVRLAEVGVGNNVLVMGPGAIGLMAAELCRRAGAARLFVGATSRRAGRIEHARAIGADEVILTDRTALTDFDFGVPVDRILVTTPPDTLPACFDLAAKGALISFVGIRHGEGRFATFDVNAFHFKKLQLRASMACPALYTPQALHYLRDGVVDGAAHISHRFSLEAIATAMETARNDPAARKVIVLPNG